MALPGVHGSQGDKVATNCRKKSFFYIFFFFFRVLREAKAYGFTEFQAEVGGLSGLLLGYSIYDLVEKAKKAFLVGKGTMFQ